MMTNTKKKYVTPTAEAIEFRAESALLTASGVSINKDQEADASESYSNNRGPWSSSIWGSDEKE